MAKLFCGDHHLNHGNLLIRKGFDGKVTGFRDFPNVQEMNQCLLKEWNKVVKPGDIVYHLGDLAMPNKGDGMDMAEILPKLNGQIVLILGNHDDKNMALFRGSKKIVKMVHIEYIKMDDGTKVMMCHYPMITWRASVHGSWHLHGHSHGNLTLCTGKMLDVGVDTCHLATHTPYAPYTWKEIVEIMANKPGNTDLKNLKEAI